MGFYAFGTRFQSFWSRYFARKDISCHAINQMLDKIVFRQSRFFLLFSTACFFDKISPCPCRFWKVLLTQILGGPLKSCVFEKIYTLSFQLHVEHPLRMQASSRFWLQPLRMQASSGFWLQ